MVGSACLWSCSAGWKVQRDLTHMSGALAGDAEMAGACLGLLLSSPTALLSPYGLYLQQANQTSFMVVGFQEEEATSLQKA